MELPGVNEYNLDLNYEVKNNGENLKFKFTGQKNIKDIPEIMIKVKAIKGILLLEILVYLFI